MDKTLQMLIRENELLTKLIHLNEAVFTEKLQRLENLYEELLKRVPKVSAEPAVAKVAEVPEIAVVVAEVAEVAEVVPDVPTVADVAAVVPQVPTVTTSGCFCR